MDKRLSSRKFLVALTGLLGAIILLTFGHIDASIWSTVTLGVSGMYLTANVVQSKPSP